MDWLTKSFRDLQDLFPKIQKIQKKSKKVFRLVEVDKSRQTQQPNPSKYSAHLAASNGGLGFEVGRKKIAS